MAKPMTAALWIAACILSFSVGYHVSTRHHQDRVFDEGRRQMLEALVNLIRSGAIEVNEDRLRDLTAPVDGQHVLEIAYPAP